MCEEECHMHSTTDLFPEELSAQGGMTTAQQILNCSFQQWYPVFKSVTFRSQIVTLSKDFVDYLVQDGVFLQEDNTAVRSGL